MRSFARRLVAILAFAASVGSAASGGGCLPPDRSVERGAIYMHLESKSQVVLSSPYRITFERISMIAGADLVDCHSVFYVERSPPILSIFDLTRGITFEHRSLKEPRCGLVAGFINNPNHVVPRVEADMPQREVGLLVRPDGVGQRGNVYIAATVEAPVYEGAPDIPIDPTFTRRFELVMYELSGFQTASTVVIHGAKIDLTFTFDTADVGAAIAASSSWDASRDGGVVTMDELNAEDQNRIKSSVAGAWRRQPGIRDIDGGL